VRGEVKSIFFFVLPPPSLLSGGPERLIEHMSGLLAPGGKLVICHSESKEKINTHHHRHADRLSLPLPPAREVAALMEPYLLPLVVEDTEQLYIVCGKRLS